MESAFGNKLFRLFFAFALIPTGIMALVGWYLSVASGGLTQTAPKSIEEINTVHLSSLDSQLHALLNLPAKDFPAGGNLFRLEIVEDSLTARAPETGSVLTYATQLVEAARRRSSGTINLDLRLAQFVSTNPGDTLIIVGTLLPEDLGPLLATYQENRAQQSIEQQVFGRYLVFLAIVFGTIVLLAGIVAYWFSGRIARHLSQPITNLSAAADSIAEGQFSVQVQPEGAGEIRSLIERFNEMANRLKSVTERLAQSERVAAWRHVARRFAHELKNPLQPMTVSLYQIQKVIECGNDIEKIKAPLEAVTEEMQRLTELAERFSSLAKLPPPSLERADLSELLQSVYELYRERLSDYAVTLKLPEQPVVAAIDASYFREALHNVLQNAAEASTHRSRITISLTATDDEAMISITDQGAGMSAGVIAGARIPYFTTKKSGSGIGLAVVEKTVSEHGGRLQIESEEDRGTTVTMILPLNSGENNG